MDWLYTSSVIVYEVADMFARTLFCPEVHLFQEINYENW